MFPLKELRKYECCGCYSLKVFSQPKNTMWDMFLSPQYWKEERKKCNPQTFRNFELLSFETQKNIKGLMGSVGCLFGNSSTFVCSNPIVIDEQKRQHGNIFNCLVRWRELHKNWILEMKRSKRPFIILPFDKRNAPKPTLQLRFFCVWKKCCILDEANFKIMKTKEKSVFWYHV